MSNTTQAETTVTIEEVVAESATFEGTVSAYKAIKILNEVLVKIGSPLKPRPTQMGYNYNKSGMLGVKGSNVVTSDELQVWLVKYINKNVL
jgi:hypothetical protein